jgi:YVTN family beta-propeller protein
MDPLPRFALSAVRLTLLLSSTPLPAQNAGYQVFVRNEQSDTISIIDGPSCQVIGTYQIGQPPRTIYYSSSTQQLYVALGG